MVSEKLTENAVNAMALARMEAERAGSASVDVEHIFLGLVSEDEGIASEVLRRSQILPVLSREFFDEMSQEGRANQRVNFSFSMNSSKIFNSALEFAVQMESENIDTEHLLLAVLAETNWKVEQLLAENCTSAERLRGLVGDAVLRRAAKRRVADAEMNGEAPRRKRAVSPTAEYAWPSSTPVFGNLSDSGIQTLMRAQEETRRLGHAFVGTEQLLLGVIADEGVAGKQFQELGITLQRARNEVLNIIGLGSGFVSVQVTFTPGANRVLRSAIEEASLLGSDKIGAEHILLSLFREKDCVGKKVLVALDVDLEDARRNLLVAMKS